MLVALPLPLEAAAALLLPMLLVVLLWCVEGIKVSGGRPGRRVVCAGSINDAGSGHDQSPHSHSSN